MCHATTCRVCGKTTWQGCGEHVDEVRAGVPVDQWCAGHEGPHPQNDSWLGRLLHR
jgi:hypothetical protein